MTRCDEVVFLALAAWREARGGGMPGMVAVCHTVLNRVRRPSWWGRDVLGVVFKAWQYSSLTDPKDRQLTKWPQRNDKSWGEALRSAEGVLDGTFPNPAPGADSYYDTSISPPRWATPGNFVAAIGRLRLHNVDNDYEKEVVT